MRKGCVGLLFAAALAFVVALTSCGGNGGASALVEDPSAAFVGYWEIKYLTYGDMVMTAEDVEERKAEGFNLFLVFNEDGTGEYNDSADAYATTWEATSASEATMYWANPDDPSDPLTITLEDGKLTATDSSSTMVFFQSDKATYDAMGAAVSASEPTGGEPTGTDEPATWTGELSDTYSNAETGYSFMAPDGFMMSTREDEDGFSGKMYLTSENPYMIIYSYVQDTNGYTIDELAANLVENYSLTVVSQDEGSMVLLGIDPSNGDTNYSKVILSKGSFYYLDIYYDPADDSQLAPVAQAIMDSFTIA